MLYSKTVCDKVIIFFFYLVYIIHSFLIETGQHKEKLMYADKVG